MHARSDILGALTPQHRARFQAFVAQLATSPVIRHPSANAASIDAMLSPEEAGAIVSISSAEREAERREMQASLQAFQGRLPLADRLNLEALEGKQSLLSPQPKPTFDPGMVLLRVTVEALGSNSDLMRRD